MRDRRGEAVALPAGGRSDTFLLISVILLLLGTGTETFDADHVEDLKVHLPGPVGYDVVLGALAVEVNAVEFALRQVDDRRTEEPECLVVEAAFERRQALAQQDDDFELGARVTPRGTAEFAQRKEQVALREREVLLLQAVSLERPPDVREQGLVVAKADALEVLAAEVLLPRAVLGTGHVAEAIAQHLFVDRPPQLVRTGDVHGQGVQCQLSPLSVNAVREDLQVSHKTVAGWLNVLERLYVVFRLPPFASPRGRAVKKEQKHYHFDWTLVPGEGQRFENLVASHLLKWVHFRQDAEGSDLELRYFRDRDGREVDFVVVEGSRPQLLVECKWSDAEVDRSLRYLRQRFPEADAWQVSADGSRDYRTPDRIRVAPALSLVRSLV